MSAKDEQARAAALKPVTVRQCDIDRLKAKLARVRKQRDEYRVKANQLDAYMASSVSSFEKSSRKLRDEQQARRIAELQESVNYLTRIVADKIVERLKVKA